MTKDRKFDPALATANGYTLEDWNDVSDNPEWTDQDFASAKPLAEALPDLHHSVVRKRGPIRTKTPVSIRLDDDLLSRLRASGPGWQARVNDALRKWIDDAA